MYRVFAVFIFVFCDPISPLPSCEPLFSCALGESGLQCSSVNVGVPAADRSMSVLWWILSRCTVPNYLMCSSIPVGHSSIHSLPSIEFPSQPVVHLLFRINDMPERHRHPSRLCRNFSLQSTFRPNPRSAASGASAKPFMKLLAL